jgi:arylformamidase
MRFDENYAVRHYDPGLPEFAHFPATIAAWEAKAASALPSLGGTLDIAYGPGEANRLDLFPAGRDAAPLIIHIHGGLWVMCDKRETWFHAPRFTKHGIAFAALNYTLAPAAPLSRIVAEVREAVAFLHREAENLGIDPAAIYLSGHSAGGHLACMAAIADWQADFGFAHNPVRGVISISGIHDLEPLLHASFLRPLIGLEEDNCAWLSPARQPAPKGVTLVTAVGGLENAEYRRQTRLMEEAWGKALVQTLLLRDRHHGTIVDALSEEGSPLFEAALSLILNGYR